MANIVLLLILSLNRELYLLTEKEARKCVLLVRFLLVVILVVLPKAILALKSFQSLEGQ